MTHRPTPHTDPPDVYETPTVTFYCEDCRINFEVHGEIVGDRDDYEFLPEGMVSSTFTTVYCPNDPASDDYDPRRHDISMEATQ